MLLPQLKLMTTRDPEGRRWFVSPSLWTQWLLPWFHREAVTKATSKRTQCSLQSYTCSDWKITFMHVQGSLTADCMTHDEPMLFLIHCQTLKQLTLFNNSSSPANLISFPHVLRSQRLIRASFLRNDLLKHLDEGEIRAIIACMHSTTINQGCYVIQEGTAGAQAYVLEGKSFFPLTMAAINHTRGYLLRLPWDVRCLRTDWLNDELDHIFIFKFLYW